MKQHILIIEDDKDINNLLKDILSHYEVTQAFTGSSGLSAFKESSIDLVLLDLMLPDLSGENLIPMIKAINPSCPIIVLTAKADVDVLVQVLELGADDYIAKPFDIKEVIARIIKQLKMQTPKVLTYQELSLNEEMHEVRYQDELLKLTAKEFEMLRLFMSNPTKVFSKANLYESIWGDTYFGDDNTIMVHVSRLRGKLQEKTGDECIETVWGIGFKLKS